MTTVFAEELRAAGMSGTEIVAGATRHLGALQRHGRGVFSAWADLLPEMTLAEKIGQLNMVTAGHAVTGPTGVVDAPALIRAGRVGSLFNLSGRAAVRARLAMMERSRINKDGELVLVSCRFRERGRNLEDGFEKLERMIERAAELPVSRVKTRPTRSSRRRRLESKRRRSGLKQERSLQGGE